MIILNLLYMTDSLSSNILFEWLGRNKITNLQLLFNAIYRHDMRLINHLLSRQDVADLIKYHYNKKNILVDIHDARHHRRCRLVDLYEGLLKHKIIKKYINKSFDTMPIACHDLKLFKLFLTNGLNCNLTDKHGNTMLHHMCKSNKLYIDNDDYWLGVKNIIMSTDCNIVNRYGNTALHEACKSSNMNTIKVAKLILDISNIDISIKNLKNETAIKHAYANNQINILQLMSNKDMSRLDESERNILARYKINNSLDTPTKKTSEPDVDIVEAKMLSPDIYNTIVPPCYILESELPPP